MSDEIDVTQWIEALRRGDEESARSLWNRYFGQLMSFARSRMRANPTTTYDEEDAAISTFRVLCEKLQAGDYPELAGRDEFWRLMLKVVVRKISRRAEYESTLKRSSLLANRQRVDETDVAVWDPSQVALEYEGLFSKLKDPNLERVAALKLDGYTNEEIATEINRTRRTVQRMLELIRELWQEELGELE